MEVLALHKINIMINWLNVLLGFQHIRTLAQDKDSPMVRIASEAPLHVSNVALVDPADG